MSSCNLHIGIDSICILRAAVSEGFSTPVSAPSFRLYVNNDMAPTAMIDVLSGRANARLAAFSKLMDPAGQSMIWFGGGVVGD